ncbi:MAG: TIGR02646 family protein [Methylococcaceae bacterium]|nr:TIGR02646 family protein [Methylococcaceae bacterium]
MRKITKGTEPLTLTNYRASIATENRHDRTVYNDFPHKSKDGCKNNESGNLRKNLLEEQGYVCCYCMSRIACKNSKIEHFKPQEEYRDRQINYQNLFIACEGKDNIQGNEHCDTKKADKELSAVNLLTHIEESIAYKTMGKIYSDNPEIDDEINTILGLNNDVLIRNRRQAYSDLINNMKRRLGSEGWTRASLQKEIDKYTDKNPKGKYAPYFSMLLFFLNKKMLSV